MSRINSLHRWIEVGYGQFAAEGPEGIQVERMARMTGLNKAGYYHYFGDRENFVEHLMNYHLKIAEQFANDMSQMKNFDPDFFHVILKYPNAILVHQQLVRNRHNEFLNKVYSQINEHVDRAILPHWARFIGLPHDHEFALKYFEQTRDMFYSRITYKTLNLEFLNSIIYESKELLQEAIRKNTMHTPS
jgi:AcrR family transcriptional regulator